MAFTTEQTSRAWFLRKRRNCVVSERQLKAVASDTKQTTTYRRDSSCPCPHSISNSIRASPHLWGGCHFSAEKMNEGVFIIWNNIYNSLSFATLNSSLVRRSLNMRLSVDLILYVIFFADRGEPCPYGCANILISYQPKNVIFQRQSNGGSKPPPYAVELNF